MIHIVSEYHHRSNDYITNYCGTGAGSQGDTDVQQHWLPDRQNRRGRGRGSGGVAGSEVQGRGRGGLRRNGGLLFYQF